jgi:putative tricarboxylic transport membrane protein
MDGPADTAKPGGPLGEILVAIGVVALGLFFLIGASSIALLPGYARIGPRFFPYLVGCGLVVAGLLLVREAFRPREQPSGQADDWTAIAWIVAGLIASAALMEAAGYIPATTLLFVLAARGLGERRYARSALAGLILALVTYLTFTRLLDLHLPNGLLASVIP